MDISLLPGQPLQEAVDNMGTLQNKKVFIGDSWIAGAGQGLFVAQTIGKGEIVTRFDGDLVEPSSDDLETYKSHLIALESGRAGRVLNCWHICSRFTAASTLETAVGSYPAGGKTYFPTTAKLSAHKLHEAGLAAFSNSSIDTDFFPNSKVEKKRGTEANGNCPTAFLIATK